MSVNQNFATLAVVYTTSTSYSVSLGASAFLVILAVGFVALVVAAVIGLILWRVLRKAGPQR